MATNSNIPHDPSSSSLCEEEISTQQSQPQESLSDQEGSNEELSHDQEHKSANSSDHQEIQIIYDTSMQPFEPPIYAGQKRTHSPSSHSSHISYDLPRPELQNSLQIYQEEPENIHDTPMLSFEPPSYA